MGASEEGVGQQPTNKDVYADISLCNATLTAPNMHMGSLKEDMSLIRKDIQETESCRGQTRSVEDQLPPLLKELKAAMQNVNMLLNKSHVRENRLQKNNKTSNFS